MEKLFLIFITFFKKLSSQTIRSIAYVEPLSPRGRKFRDILRVYLKD